MSLSAKNLFILGLVFVFYSFVNTLRIGLQRFPVELFLLFHEQRLAKREKVIWKNWKKTKFIKTIWFSILYQDNLNQIKQCLEKHQQIIWIRFFIQWKLKHYYIFNEIIKFYQKKELLCYKLCKDNKERTWSNVMRLPTRKGTQARARARGASKSKKGDLGNVNILIIR